MVTTGFDLDMTLIDSRPGVAAVYQALSDETGVWIDVDEVIERLGPPLEQELSNWVDANNIATMAALYRELYPGIAPALIEPLPGALDAVAAARERGRVILVTAKAESNARLHVDRLGFTFDRVAGDVWWKAKADVLRAEDAGVYVGDHIHDMQAAVLADAAGYGVATGPSSRAELTAAGAATTADSLLDFGHWISAAGVE